MPKKKLKKVVRRDKAVTRVLIQNLLLNSQLYDYPSNRTDIYGVLEDLGFEPRTIRLFLDWEYAIRGGPHPTTIKAVLEYVFYPAYKRHLQNTYVLEDKKGLLFANDDFEDNSYWWGQALRYHGQILIPQFSKRLVLNQVPVN